jgi:hypothetical protein
MSLIHIVVSVTTHEKTFPECNTLCEKSDGMLLPGAGFVNDFHYYFLQDAPDGPEETHPLRNFKKYARFEHVFMNRL